VWAKTTFAGAHAAFGGSINAPLHERRFDRGLAPLPAGWRAVASTGLPPGDVIGRAKTRPWLDEKRGTKHSLA
jgi:hypothetical protein